MDGFWGAMAAFVFFAVCIWYSIRYPSGQRMSDMRDDRGAPAGISRGIVFQAAEPRPVRPELRPYLQSIIDIYRRDRNFYSKEIIAIGNEINQKAGYNGMVEVCDALLPLFGKGAHRMLEERWDGVGEWQAN